MTVATLAVAGDSLAQGTAFVPSVGQGGKGCWAELAAEELASLAGIGPLVSSGMRGCHLGVLGSNSEVVYAGSWTDVLSTDAWDLLPHGVGRYSAAGSSAIVTWTRPSQWRTAVGVAINYVDYTGGGNWQYRKDGGAYTAHGQTLQHNNKIRRFYVSGAVTTIDFRAYDGATGAGCFIDSVEWYWLDPTTTTQGLIVHNRAVGTHSLHELAATTSGDRMAVFDSVQLGTGSPISPTANVGTALMVINDVSSSTSVWNTDLTTFNTRMSPLGPVGLIVPYEVASTKSAFATQVAWRAQSHTSATALGMSIFDIRDVWTTNGWGTTSGTQTAAIIAAGLIADFDGVHENPAGHLDLGPRLFWWFRQMLGIGQVSTAYPVLGKQSTPAYAAQRPAATYSAGVPIAVA